MKKPPLEGPNFRDIKVNEVLAEVENACIHAPTDYYDAMWELDDTSNHVLLPWGKTHGLFAMRPGEVILFGGYAGHNKSTISEQVAVGAMRQGFNVGIASLELREKKLLRNICNHAAGTMRYTRGYAWQFVNWCNDKLHIYGPQGLMTPAIAIQMTIALAKLRGCQLIIIDNLMTMGLDTEDRTGEKDFINTLSSVARQFQVSIILVHHVRKPDSSMGEKRIPNKYDFFGSSMIANLCHSIVVCWSDKEKKQAMQDGDEYDDSMPDQILSIVKQRDGEYEGKFGLWQSKTCRSFCPTPARKHNPMTFTNEVDDESLLAGKEQRTG